MQRRRFRKNGNKRTSKKGHITWKECLENLILPGQIESKGADEKRLNLPSVLVQMDSRIEFRDIKKRNFIKNYKGMGIMGCHEIKNHGTSKNKVVQQVLVLNVTSSSLKS